VPSRGKQELAKDEGGKDNRELGEDDHYKGKPKEELGRTTEAKIIAVKEVYNLTMIKLCHQEARML